MRLLERRAAVLGAELLELLLVAVVREVDDQGRGARRDVLLLLLLLDLGLGLRGPFLQREEFRVEKEWSKKLGPIFFNLRKGSRFGAPVEARSTL